VRQPLGLVVVAEQTIAVALAALAATAAVATALALVELVQTQQLTTVEVVVVVMQMVALVALVLSSFATPEASAELVALSHHPAATPFTHSIVQAHSPHKELAWHILQKFKMASSFK
jgi:hypothetical protein